MPTSNVRMSNDLALIAYVGQLGMLFLIWCGTWSEVIKIGMRS